MQGISSDLPLSRAAIVQTHELEDRTLIGAERNWLLPECARFLVSSSLCTVV